MLALLLALSVPVSITFDWRISERTDPVVDSAEIWAVVGDQRQHVAVGCDKGESSRPRLVIRTGKYLGAEKRGILLGGRDITVRFDDKPPLVWRAEYEEDGIVEDKAEHVAKFVTAAMGARRMVIRALNYEFEEVDLIYEFSDPSEVIRTALNRCAAGERG